MQTEFHDQVTAAMAAEEAEQVEVVEWIRRELRADFERAEQQLPILKEDLRRCVAYVAGVEAEVQRLGAYPDQLRGFIDQLKNNFNAANQVEAGIRKYKTLTFKDLAWKDGRQIDVNRRAAFIGEARFLLRSYDGRLSRCKSLRIQADMFIRNHQWVRGRPATLMTVAVPPPRRDPAPRVESQFEV